ncbi:MAG: catalase, partial [Oscillospiraceae bacterium]|nr:catalase [Oscillospiraceae bacterium]
WTDYVQGIGVAPIEMPLPYLIEMFCDRVAACKIYQKDAYRQDAALRYYENAKSHYIIHPNTAALLEKLLVMLAQQGEDAVFHYIRKELLGK